MGFPIDGDLYRHSDTKDLNYGLTNFDNIFNAFLTIFQCITLEGWTVIMYMMQDAYTKYITSIYFVLAVVVCAFFLINLTIAIMLKNYDELDKNEKNTTHQANLIEIGMKTKLPSKLIYFIVGEENLIVSKKANKRLKDQGENQTLKNQIIESFIYTKIEIPNDSYYKNKFTRFFYFLVQVPMFGTIILFCILINTIFLSLERYPMPDSEKEAYENVNYFFSSVFAIEVVLKIIGLSPRKFVMDKFNIFDSLIVLVSVVELFFSSGSGGGVSALRAFRLFRIFKLFRTGNLRVLLDSIAYTMGTIGNYVILLGLFIYVYSLLGMQFFAGKLTFDEDGFYDPNGEVARANFDQIHWAAITVFEVLIGDNWNIVMFDCIKSVGVVSSIYFISLILFGSIIMLNLFLAILLGNFDKARSFWLKKSIFEMFETAVQKKYSLSKAISIILGDVNRSVKEELLFHHEKDIFRLNGRLMIINRKQMEIDADAQDKLAYYDKYADYELDYEPIIEVYIDEFEEGKDSADDNYNYESSKQQDKDEETSPKQLPQIQELIEEHDEKEESSEEQQLERADSGTMMRRNLPRKLPPLDNAKIFDHDMNNTNMNELRSKSGNLGIDDENRGLHFVTLGTPRRVIDDLEDNKEEDEGEGSEDQKKFLKSVTFDVRKLEEKQPTQSDKSESYEEEKYPETEVEKLKEEYFAGDNILEFKEPPAWKKFLYRLKNSSLFIFHRD
jgi:hypothetical protein